MLAISLYTGPDFCFLLLKQKKNTLVGRKQPTSTNQLVGNPECKMYILDLHVFLRIIL